MKILFATKNPAKIRRYVNELEKRNIEVLTIKDLDISLHVEESGKDALENAYIKAKAYYDATGLTTIAVDDNLYLEELPDDKQPGTHVRRVNGKELTDEEMITYYTDLARQYGGRLNGKWKYGMVIYNGVETKQYTWEKGDYCIVDKPCEKRNPGYPLDSIAVSPKYNKYWFDVTEEEKGKGDNEEEVIEFIISNIMAPLR